MVAIYVSIHYIDRKVGSIRFGQKKGHLKDLILVINQSYSREQCNTRGYYLLIKIKAHGATEDRKRRNFLYRPFCGEAVGRGKIIVCLHAFKC